MALREVVAPEAPLRGDPTPDAPLETEALKGERVEVEEDTEEGWCRVTLRSDGYAGWMPASALAAPGPVPTHKVAVLRTLAFPAPSIKLPPLEGLSFGSRLAVKRFDGAFAITSTGLHLPARHLTPVDQYESDSVAVAERFLGAPYLWGGKTGLGIDCSGLVQIALTACGIACPRDSGPQQQALGVPIDLSQARRGDLVFWKGHVAMLHDDTHLIHANAYHMAVAIEPLTEAIARIRAAGAEVASVKRL